jgi:hypothetical protein
MSRQSSVPELDSSLYNNWLYAAEHFCITSFTDHAGNKVSIVEEARLLIRFLAMDVLLLGAFTYAGMCLPSRYLAMGVHVTISKLN